MNQSLSKHGGMSWIQRMVVDKFYRQSEGQPEKLPWHRDQPDPLFKQVAEARQPGRALDIGCGSGIFSAYLAKLGYQVTAIDWHAEAITMADDLAADTAGMQVIRADFLTYQPGHQFDLILDSGCLHNLHEHTLTTYKDQLLGMLAKDGDYVLEHWDKRHWLDWRPIGPARRAQATIRKLFAPALSTAATRTEVFEVAMPIGPLVAGTCYHFRRDRHFSD